MSDDEGIDESSGEVRKGQAPQLACCGEKLGERTAIWRCPLVDWRGVTGPRFECMVVSSFDL